MFQSGRVGSQAIRSVIQAIYDVVMKRSDHTLTDRRLPLEGAPNFRDIGGYPAADGGTIRRGLLYRSGALAGLTDTDVDTLNTIGLAAILDLRNDAERRAAPTPETLAAASRVHSLPIGTGEGATPVPRPALLTVADATAEQAVAAIRDSYRRFTREHTARFAALFHVLLDGPATSTVIHCTAGKDRTGISVALVQLALGASRDTVIEDYCRTRDHLDLEWRERILLAMTGDPALVNRKVADVMFDAHPDYIGASLDEIHARHGSPRAYLRDVLDLDDRRIGQLRARYLE